MGSTKIEWTRNDDGTAGKTWNPIRGCSRVSQGCTNCYAERQAARFAGPGMPFEGLATIGKNGPRWTGQVRLMPDHLGDPLSWRKPQRVFVNSMSDLFHEKLSNEDIAAVFGVMAVCPQHMFQVLTKRPEQARDWFRWAATAYETEDLWRGVVIETGHVPAAGTAWPLPNVWLGVSVEDQATADERIPVLLDTPAALRFVSAEPLLGPVELMPYLRPMHTMIARPPSAERAKFFADLAVLHEDAVKACTLVPQDVAAKVEIIPGVGLDWVIVGGESGPGARPFHLEWVRDLVRQCEEARAACFVKQLGAVPLKRWPSPVTYNGRPLGQLERVRLKDRKGGDMAEWPEDLRVREFPTPRTSNLPEKSESPPAVGRIGNKSPAKTEVTPGG